ncbi:MAG: methionyl-tRNA formyltransferase, partial [Flavobacteriales bacterium]|nr:methionyl-tRNA formyltransferase [Flavobacteriales bacterium]
SYNCVVFHMTDLPYGRGGSPLQNLISRGFSETKISAILVEKQLDAGPVYLKMSLSLLGSAEEVFIRANRVIGEMITKIIDECIKPAPQIGIPTMFKRRTPEMSEITNELKEVDYLYDHIRMLDAEGYPKAFLETNFFKFEFTRASLKSDGSIISDVKITKK